jgi:hypothetical protein
MLVDKRKLCGMQLLDALLSHCGYFYYTRMDHGKLSWPWPSCTSVLLCINLSNTDSAHKDKPHACALEAVDPCSWQLS